MAGCTPSLSKDGGSHPSMYGNFLKDSYYKTLALSMRWATLVAITYPCTTWKATIVAWYKQYACIAAGHKVYWGSRNRLWDMFWLIRFKIKLLT